MPNKDSLREEEHLRIKVNAILNPDDDESKFVDTEDIQKVVDLLTSHIEEAERGARFDEHKIIMANVGSEYSRAIHAHPELKLDPDLIKKTIEKRAAKLEEFYQLKSHQGETS